MDTPEYEVIYDDNEPRATMLMIRGTLAFGDPAVIGAIVYQLQLGEDIEQAIAGLILEAIAARGQSA